MEAVNKDDNESTPAQNGDKARIRQATKEEDCAPRPYEGSAEIAPENIRNLGPDSVIEGAHPFDDDMARISRIH